MGVPNPQWRDFVYTLKRFCVHEAEILCTKEPKM